MDLLQTKHQNLKSSMPSLSVIIPFYNESVSTIHKLQDVVTFLKQSGMVYEIICVNDGSTTHGDVLHDTARELGLTHIVLDKNKGKGYALARGVQASAHDYVVLFDADQSTPIETITACLPHLETHDIIIGTRHDTSSTITVQQPILRRIISWIARHIIRVLILDPSISDSQCGFKILRRSVAQDIFSRQHVYRWGFDVEMLAIAKIRKYRIMEIPVTWHHEPISAVRSFPDSIRTFFEILYIKYNILDGVYIDNHEKHSSESQ